MSGEDWKDIIIMAIFFSFMAFSLTRL